MAEKTLDLLQRIAEETAIAFHAGLGLFVPGVPQSMLNQHRKHMHGEGMPKLVRADANQISGGGAATAGAREHDLPGIGLHGLTDFGQPESSGFFGRTIVTADHKPTALLRRDSVDQRRAAVDKREPDAPGIGRRMRIGRSNSRQPNLFWNLATASVRSTST